LKFLSLTDIDGSELVAVVESPGTTPVTKRSTLATLKAWILGTPGTLESLLPRALSFGPGSDTYIALTTAEADVSGTDLDLTIVAPPSGKVEVTLQASLVFGPSTLVLWHLTDAAHSLSSDYMLVTTAVQTETANVYTASTVISGLTPFVSYTLRWRHVAAANDACQVRVWSGVGAFATTKATPLAA
jgi:hypothetical protein